MKKVKFVIGALAIAASFLHAAPEVSDPELWNATRKLVEEEIRYSGLSDRVSQKEIDTLADLKMKGESPGLSKEERTNVYRELFTLLHRIMGNDNVPKQTLDRNINLALSWSTSSVPATATPSPVAAPATFGSVQKVGNGKITMILLPDMGADWKVYESFMKRNEAAYSMYAVTLPGFAGSPVPARPPQRDYSNLDWWKNAEEALVKLIHKENLKDVVLVGHIAGGYLAMRTAIDHPEIIDSVVLMNSLIYGPPPSDPSKILIKQERKEMVNSWVPAGFFPRPTPEKYKEFLSSMASGIAMSEEHQKAVVSTMSNMSSNVWWHYYCELMTTDLTDELSRSKVPILVLISLYDKASGSAMYGKLTVDQWEGFHQKFANVPIQIVTLEDTRAYIQFDRPKEMDAAIGEFLTK